MTFTDLDYRALSALFGRPGYRGYRPSVVEAPNGDGRLDVGKRYLHVAAKYDPPEYAQWFLARAHLEACRMAERLGIPDAYYPRAADATLRVLDYPPGAGSAQHTDPNLFTLTMYRSTPEGLVVVEGASPECYIGELGELVGLGPATAHRVDPLPIRQQSVVYFAMPSHSAILPDGRTVASWLDERMHRSRYA